MATAELPREKAVEPVEEASQPENSTMSPTVPKKRARKTKITFEPSLEPEEAQSQTSSIYKDVLSQPAAHMSHKDKMLWLQKRRVLGLWVQCDSCQRWRYLSDVLDSHELPKNWYCAMHNDKEQAHCSFPEAKLRVRDEEDLIHNEYSAGSLVWARMQGWPFWPAMVDDDPDTEQFYWLDGFSDIPTYYNVVFFDKDATRAWISPENLKPYTYNKKMLNVAKKIKRRLELAVEQANDAAKLKLGDRLAKYSFISRYEGRIGSPINASKKVLQRFQKKLQKKYNIDFPIESDGSADDNDTVIQEKQEAKQIKKRNVIIVGTPKRVKTPAQRIVEETEELKDIQDEEENTSTEPG